MGKLCETFGVAAPLRLRQPAEWAPQRALWVGYPSDPALWLQHLEPAQKACLALCRVFGKTQAVRLVVRHADEAAAAQACLRGLNVEMFCLPYG
ncbi:MAG: hypothetical protein EOO40_10145, partial [Deltaproteobacteria bacterium]